MTHDETSQTRMMTPGRDIRNYTLVLTLSSIGHCIALHIQMSSILRRGTL